MAAAMTCALPAVCSRRVGALRAGPERRGPASLPRRASSHSARGSSLRSIRGSQSICAKAAASSQSLAGGSENIDAAISLGGGGGGGAGAGGSGSGGSGDWNSDGGNSADSNGSEGGNILAMLAKGWSERVDADPQFVFKVLTEQIIGVTACVLGDMATRPNFGLNELDFVFCTLVVGSIVNFALMYLLAPTSAPGALARSLPSIFSSCPPGHMFEGGAYSLLSRVGTFAYKGAQFAGVGFLAGLTGTAISTLLLGVRRLLQPSFILQNSPPPPFLNATTWALHMGLSSNLRYQCLNGLDQVVIPIFSPNLFRVFSFLIRAANNLIGGSTFVMLAKATGSQKAAQPPAQETGDVAAVKENVGESIPAVQ